MTCLRSRTGNTLKEPAVRFDLGRLLEVIGVGALLFTIALLIGPVTAQVPVPAEESASRALTVQQQTPAPSQRTAASDRERRAELMRNPPGTELSDVRPLDSIQFTITFALFAFCIILTLLQIIGLRKIPNLRADDILRNVSVTLVIISTMILMIAGFGQENLAPAFGLFGTIIGYILGRADRPPPPNQDQAAVGNDAMKPKE
jgi:hypothetical protein